MSSEYKPKLDSGYSYYVLSLLLLVYIFNFLDRQIIAILAPDIQKDLGISLGDLGFLYGTAFAIFYAIMGVPLAKLADSWNRTKLISIGVGLWSFMTAASGLARGFIGLAFCRIGVGVGESSASPAAYSLLADFFSDRIKTTVYSIYASGIYIGGGIGIFLGGWIADSWNAAYPISELAPFGFAGWQIAFISVGLPGLIVALLVLTIKEPLRGHTEDVEIKKVDKPFKEAGKMLAGIIPFASIINLYKDGSDKKEIYLQLDFKLGIFLLIFVMGVLTSDWMQWSAFGLGLYALFSWIQTVKIKDPVSYEIVFKSKTMNLIMVAFPLFSFMGYAVSAFLPTYFMETFEVSKTIAGRNLGLQSAIFGFLGLLFGEVIR
jgi:MFS family permease